MKELNTKDIQEYLIRRIRETEQERNAIHDRQKLYHAGKHNAFKEMLGKLDHFIHPKKKN